MKTMRFFVILTILLCLTAGSVQARDYGKNESYSHPFKATILYSYASHWSSGSGTATHLGVLTTMSSFIDLKDGDSNIIGTRGHDVLTAADGSTLIMDWSATLNADYSEDGTYKFSGGTGRFEDASGSGAIHAIFTAEYDILLTVTGTLTYHNKCDDNRRNHNFDRGDDNHRGNEDHRYHR